MKKMFSDLIQQVQDVVELYSKIDSNNLTPQVMKFYEEIEKAGIAIFDAERALKEILNNR